MEVMIYPFPYRHIYVCEWSTTEAAITLNVSLHVTWMGVLLQLSYSKKKFSTWCRGRRYLRRRRNEKFSFVRNHQAFPWEESLKCKQIKVFQSKTFFLSWTSLLYNLPLCNVKKCSRNVQVNESCDCIVWNLIFNLSVQYSYQHVLNRFT